MAHSRRPTRGPRSPRLIPLELDALEPRLLLSALTVAQARNIYAFDQLSFAGGTISADGRGQTIAIVGAFDDPTIMNDLNVFDSTMPVTNGVTLAQAYGEASSVLTRHAMSTTITTDAGWAQEISLDVEWAHAIAPGAHLLLVEAASDSMTDLLAAVNYARSQAGVSVVSMSWGTSEFSTELDNENVFTTPTGHAGVTFVAAAGDSAGTIWPSVSPYVLAVGGTTLASRGGTYLGEAAWSDTGGGTSSIENAPAFETALTGSSQRVAPDVSYDADPNTGFLVYDSTPEGGVAGWQVYGGTSAGTPQWAALIAIANEGRALLGKSSLDGPTQTLPAIDELPASDFHDVTVGGSFFDSATAGFDDLTGRGSPVANRLIIGLLTWNTTEPNVTRTATSVTNTTTRRRPFDVSLAAVEPGVVTLQQAAERGAETLGVGAALAMRQGTPIWYTMGVAAPAAARLQLLA